MPGYAPTIAVCLIVRDEQQLLPSCLDSVRELADELVVCDTGSVDGTREVATRTWTKVFSSPWPDHFAEARNAALARCSADWVLSIDADELAVGRPSEFRAAVAGIGPEIDACAIEIVPATGPDCRGLGARWEHKLFRRSAVCWVGRVHERLERPDGAALRTTAMPSQLLSLRHRGYCDPAVAAAKAERNARLCEIELAQLNSGHVHPSELGGVLLDLGRSYFGSGRSAEAVEALQQARVATVDGHCWMWATDILIRIALTRQDPHLTLTLVQELESAGAQAAYCDWLRAQALALRGDLGHAALILQGLGPLVDVGGNKLDDAPVLALRDAISAQASAAVHC